MRESPEDALSDLFFRDADGELVVRAKVFLNFFRELGVDSDDDRERAGPKVLEKRTGTRRDRFCDGFEGFGVREEDEGRSLFGAAFDLEELDDRFFGEEGSGEAVGTLGREAKDAFVLEESTDLLVKSGVLAEFLGS